MAKPYERTPEETDRSWQAFSDFLSMEPPRILSTLHAQYVNTENPPTDKYGTLRTWSAKYSWPKREAAYNKDAGERRLAQIAAQGDERALSQITDFTNAHKQFGRSGLETAMRANQSIIKFLRSNPDVNTIEDAAKMANILKAIFPIASDAWAKSVGVDQVMDQFTNDA